MCDWKGDNCHTMPQSCCYRLHIQPFPLCRLILFSITLPNAQLRSDPWRWILFYHSQEWAAAQSQAQDETLNHIWLKHDNGTGYRVSFFRTLLYLASLSKNSLILISVSKKGLGMTRHWCLRKGLLWENLLQCPAFCSKLADHRLGLELTLFRGEQLGGS